MRINFSTAIHDTNRPKKWHWMKHHYLKNISIRISFQILAHSTSFWLDQYLSADAPVTSSGRCLLQGGACWTYEVRLTYLKQDGWPKCDFSVLIFITVTSKNSTTTDLHCLKINTNKITHILLGMSMIKSAQNMIQKA